MNGITCADSLGRVRTACSAPISWPKGWRNAFRRRSVARHNYALAVRGPRLAAHAGLAREGWARSRHDYDPNRCFSGDRSDPARPWSGGYSLGYELGPAVPRYPRHDRLGGRDAIGRGGVPVLAPILVLVPILETLAVEQRDLH